MVPRAWIMGGSAAPCSPKATLARPVPRCYPATLAKVTPPTGHSRASRARTQTRRKPITKPSSEPSSPGGYQQNTVSSLERYKSLEIFVRCRPMLVSQLQQSVELRLDNSVDNGFADDAGKETSADAELGQDVMGAGRESIPQVFAWGSV